MLEKLKATFKQIHFWNSIKCEFMMTLFYVLFGCAATATHFDDVTDTSSSSSSSDAVSDNGGNSGVLDVSPSTPSLNAAVAFGLIGGVMLHCAMKLDGTVHLNPAVTIAMLCTRRSSVLQAIFHILAQCLGKPIN